MLTFSKIAAMQACLSGWRQDGERIALVPTMGNLHAGHLALVTQAKQLADRVVVSIFVNPMQFDRKEDLDAYPQTLEKDAELLKAQGVDLLFAPEASIIYPESLETATQIYVPVITERLEGASRSGHFTGVATIVCKLFNMVQPEIAVFGEKDYQQLLVIRKMVADLDISVQIESVPTVREKDGLAMSSRNGYLTQAERAIAPQLYKTLQFMQTEISANNANMAEIESNGIELLRKAGFKPDYLEVCQSDSLQPATPEDTSLVILAAAWLGKARLIDNLSVNLKPDA